MNKQKIIAVLWALMSVSSVSATIVQLNVTGQTVTQYPFGPDVTDVPDVAFSASFFFDAGVADDNPQNPLRGNYSSSLGQGVLIYNGVTYTETGMVTSTFVRNGAGGVHDAFGYIASFNNGAGDVIHFALQFIDSTETVFSDDSHPVSFDLDQFDPFDFNPGFGTYAIVFFINSNSDPVYGPMEFAQLRPVPLPAALWLLVSGIGFLLFVPREK